MTPIADAIEKGIDIIVPTWNHLKLLQTFAEHLQRSSKYPHKLWVFVNDGSDGTRSWVKTAKGIGVIAGYVHSSKNEGVCVPVNEMAALGSAPMVAYMNDDMVLLPGWDVALHRFARVNRLPKLTWLSGTMIEPTGSNDCCIIKDYGRGPDTLKLKQLIADLPQLRKRKHHVGGTTWPPTFLMRSVFNKVGGFSEEYFPGFGSDPDLAKKLWDLGCRTYVGVADCLVYHFMSKTTGNMTIPPYRQIFAAKHGMPVEHFVENVLHRGSVWPPKENQ